ncbi:hypothetical protein [Paludisphaera borealis]|uniref:Secreted protein n=1 Tax=Paludisphaera borealis TaxID=1387353 RepID=A0A1U7CUJ9_9BACT|nr:hypothetical protein [Paludisphaera borealis]APW62624.1 hypothetical protein BSF38_04174 [Paludisphaera borealis]
MRNTFRLALLCGLVLVTASTADAQWGRGRSGGGVVMGPDGPLYDTRSPEWRMSGGNIFVYQELMEQKMELAQQKYMYQQMQQAAKQQKNQANGKGKTKAKTPSQSNGSPLNTPAAAGFNDPFAEPVNHYKRKKYKSLKSSSTVSSKTDKAKTAPSNTTP